VGRDSSQHLGIAPRAASQVFELIAAAAPPDAPAAADTCGRFEYDVSLQLLEIYNVSAGLAPVTPLGALKDVV